jgi:hypothetical protein
MYWDYVLLGLLLLVNAGFVAVLSFKSAKNKTDYQSTVVGMSILLSLCFFPAGWVHYWYWRRRMPDQGFIKFD